MVIDNIYDNSLSKTSKHYFGTPLWKVSVLYGQNFNHDVLETQKPKN